MPETPTISFAGAVTITPAGVAALLGISKSTLLDRIGRMRREHQFPSAIPCTGGRQYSRAAVLAWIDGARPAAPPANAPIEDDIAACEAQLLNRARAMAAE